MAEFIFNPINGFRDTAIFPDPANEPEARAQVQSLLDQARNAVNAVDVDLQSTKITLTGDYETISDLENNRKLSSGGDFTGTLNGGAITSSDVGLAATVDSLLINTASHYGSIASGISLGHIKIDAVNAATKGIKIDAEGFAYVEGKKVHVPYLVNRLGTDSWVECLVYVSGGIVLAGTSEGNIYRSTNYGQTWDNVKALGGSNGINCMASPSTGNIVAGTSGGNIYISPDGGINWSLVGTLDGELGISSLVSLGAGTVLAGTSPNGKIYRSVNNGGNWALKQRLGTENSVESLVSLGSGVVLAGAGVGNVYKSIDDGAIWIFVEKLGDSSGIKLVSLGSGVVLAGLEFNEADIYKSSDSGDTWTFMYRLAGQVAISCLASLGGDVVIAGISNLGSIFKSTDGGTTWNFDMYMGNALEVRSALHNDYTGELLVGTSSIGNVYRLMEVTL